MSQSNPPDLPFPPIMVAKAYRTFQKMMRYPRLLEEIREIFVRALEERGIVDPESLREEARRLAELSGESGEKALREHLDALVDLHFVNSFDEAEIENHINLARKQDRFRHLSKVLNTEGATSRKIKQALKEFCEVPKGGLYLSPSEAMGARVALINHFVSNQLPFIGIAKHHITIRDIYELVEHSLWNRRRPGRIGGKAAGMYLAYKILVPKLRAGDPEIQKYVRIPESYYFNSGIFSDFIDYNKLDHFHTQKYKTREVIEEEYRHIAQLFHRASFPSDVMEDFRKFLEKIGEHPLVLRSSSLLEDNFGFAFSGKYDSVFLANQGPLEERLEELVWGLKQVHMSTYGPSPILYRQDHDLLDFDEKMSVLVQKVVGRRFGKHFFPFAAGVAFSYSSYGWTPRIRKEDGLLRLVFGLGTRAVDRTGQDYPRMVYLSHPALRPEVTAEQIRKYSQKIVDVLDLESGSLQSLPFQELMRLGPHPDLFYAVSVEREGHLAPLPFKTCLGGASGGTSPAPGQTEGARGACLTFDNLLSKTPFVPLVKKVLEQLEEAYGRPVDVEFAWDGGLLYILQCRTLAVARDEGRVPIPEVSREKTLFATNRALSSGVIRNVEYIVYVDPKAYDLLASYEEKLAVGRVVGALNRGLRGKRYALLGPGRWGSNDINLGVRVSYSDINHALALGEIAFEKKDFTPEVSYGTHFFNDLVEAGITPVAVFPDDEGCSFQEDFFLRAPNALTSLAPEWASHAPVVRVIHVPSASQGDFLHIHQDGMEQKGIGFLAGRQAARR